LPNRYVGGGCVRHGSDRSTSQGNAGWVGERNLSPTRLPPFWAAKLLAFANKNVRVRVNPSGMNGGQMLRNRVSPQPALVALAAVCFCIASAEAQLFTNLRDLVRRYPVGPLAHTFDGPKGIATADLDKDGNADVAVANTDGSVSVFFGLGNGGFRTPLHLSTGGTNSLRGIVCADLNGDGWPDIATAAPFQGTIFEIGRASCRERV